MWDMNDNPKYRYMKKNNVFLLLATLMLFGAGVQAQGADCTTPIVVTASAPFFEDFEGGVMPDCWTQSGGGTWTVGSGDYGSGTQAYWGASNAVITHDSTGQVTMLKTPWLDLSGLANCQLRFFQLRRDWGGDLDLLAVSYRTSDTGGWQQLAAYTTEYADWTESVITLPSTVTTCQLAFVHTDNYGYGTAIDEVYVGAPPSCLRVYDISATVDSSGSVTVSWVDTLNVGATYTLMYWTSSGDTGMASTADTTVTLTGLYNGLRYRYKLATNCADGVTLIGGGGSWTMPCGPFHVPYAENFEDFTFDNYGTNYRVPHCWMSSSRYNTNVTHFTQMAHSGDMVLSIYGENYAVLPPMEMPAGLLQVRFWLRPGNNPYNENTTFSVGYIADTSDATSFFEVISWPYSSFEGYEEKVAMMYGAPDSARIVLRSNATSSTFSWYVDDVVVEAIPPCPQPINVFVEGATTGTLDIRMLGVVDSYRVYWSDTAMIDSADVYDSLYTITGLAADTRYTIAVATLCGDGSVTRAVTVRGRTRCLPAPIPYSDDFDGYPHQVSPYCYTVLRGEVLAYNRGSYHAHSGTQVLLFAGEPVNAVALPRMDAPTDSLQVRFWLAPLSSGTFEVGYMTDLSDDSTFVPLDSWRNSEWTVSDLREKTVPMYGAPANAWIVMRSEGGTTAYWTVDDLVVEPMPPCPPVSRLSVAGIGVDSIAMAFSGGRTGNYRLCITDGGSYSDTVYVNAANSYTFTGLAPLTTYTVSVASDCGDGLSDPRSVTVTTYMLADTLPYSTGFEPSDDVAWRFVSKSNYLSDETPNKWVIGTAIAHTGSHSLYISDDGGVSNHYDPGTSTSPWFTNAYAYKTFLFDRPGDYIVSYDWHINSNSYARVVLAPGSYTPDGSDRIMNLGEPEGWIALDSSHVLANGPDWQSRTWLFNVDSAGPYHLIFYLHAGGTPATQPPAAIDNVRLERVACPVPRNLVVDSVSRTGATFSWTPYGDESEWEVTVDGTTAMVNYPAYTATGLDNTTTYTVGVRPVCGVGDTGMVLSRWFTTALCENSVVMENYDTTERATFTSNSPLGDAMYKYGYAQTIIPASRLEAAGAEIKALAVMPDEHNYGVVLKDIDVYMANVRELSLWSGFIYPDSSHRFVKVISDADFSYSDLDLQVHGFDTTFTWDGQSNVLVAVHRKRAGIPTNNYLPSYAAHRSDAYLTRCVTTYDDPLDINTVEGGTASYMVGDIYLISCPAGCPEPVVTDVQAYADEVTVFFEATDTVEVYITSGTWNDNVSGMPLPPGTNSYTFSGLDAMTHYNVGIRHVCDDSTTSGWVVSSVTTIDVSCLPPTGFALGATAMDAQEFSWTPSGVEAMWQIHIFNGFTNALYTVMGSPATVSGLYYGTTYHASIRSLCGSSGNWPGPWGDTLTFTTVDCPAVPGVTVDDVTASSATVSWQPVDGSVGYRIYYGREWFYVSEATVVDVDANTTSYEMTGLEGATSYDVFVLNRCSDAILSGVTDGQRVTFTTAVGIDAVEEAALMLYPNPASGSVTLSLGGFEGQVCVQVVDMNGRTLATTYTSDSQTALDVSSLQPGAYFLRVTGSSQTAVRKLIIARL